MGPAHGDPDLAPRSELLELLAACGIYFRRTARRFSLCLDDAEDAYQYAVEILLTKAPPLARPQLAAWMQVVTRREALRLRSTRERALGVRGDEVDGPDEILRRVPSADPGPAEIAEARERLRAAARSLGLLNPDQRRAIALQAYGYSYAEIARICGWTQTKVNRCLAEGRERLRRGAPADLAA